MKLQEYTEDNAERLIGDWLDKIVPGILFISPHIFGQMSIGWETGAHSLGARTTIFALFIPTSQPSAWSSNCDVCRHPNHNPLQALASWMKVVA